jgi:hypothetical protein
VSTLKLIAKVLNTDLKNSDLTDESRLELIENSVREFAVDLLNKYNFLKEKNVEDNTLRELMRLEDVDFNLKTKKFF